jgi:hypothetical protein
MDDLALLRTFEPILKFTEGELFFPCAVDGYIKRCSLLPRTRDRDAPAIVPAGELDVDRLVREANAINDRPLCLRLIEHPLTGADYARWLTRKDKPVFHTTGRLARVGLTARFVDSLFSLSLLLRGTVPGGTAAAAEQQYQAMLGETPGYVYHGRVLRQGGFVVLNYLFFYFMNDWRSTFSGVNDHEADWEQIFVYLAKGANDELEPAWVAYASHDYHGDDLRRRWDDPELTIEGTHPVVFPGAGSHSSYFQAGEYITSVELRHAKPLIEGLHFAQYVWRDVLHQGESEVAAQIEALFRIPFVDYARGDGIAIGPGQPNEWQPVVISEETPWVESYRGLWGLDTHDPLEGELAPSGPKYQRDGSVRQTWYDPLGWSGLGKVATPASTQATLVQHISELEQELIQIEERLEILGDALPRLDLEVRSLFGVAHLQRLHEQRKRELLAMDSERGQIETRRVEIEETLQACRRSLAQLEGGDFGPAQAHVLHKRSPQRPAEIAQSRIAEIWAGLSIAVLLLGWVAVILLARENWAIALFLVIAAVVIVENALRRSVQRLLLNGTIVLAVASAAALIYRFFWQLGLIAIVVIALVILRDNLRELRST